MKTFNVPTREEVSPTNQGVFDHLQNAVGFVPNLFATYAYSDNALKNYMEFSNAKTSLKTKEKEVVNLAVSQVNNCQYCLSAHTAVGKMSRFTDDQILEIRSGKASFDKKLDALAKLAKNITENRGKTEDSIVDNFFEVGWTIESLIDAISLVGDKTISNYIHNATKVPVDFPVAEPLNVSLV